MGFQGESIFEPSFPAWHASSAGLSKSATALLVPLETMSAFRYPAAGIPAAHEVAQPAGRLEDRLKSVWRWKGGEDSGRLVTQMSTLLTRRGQEGRPGMEAMGDES